MKITVFAALLALCPSAFAAVPCNVPDSPACGDLKTEIAGLQNTDVCARVTAAKCLSSVARHKAVAPLLRALRDNEPQVRAQAALSLGATGHETAEKVLVKMLSSDADASVRAACADALGDLENPGAGAALASALASDKSDDVKINAAEGLGKLNYDDGVEDLALALKNKNPQVRIAAADGLGGFYGLPAARTLAGIMLLDPDPKVRASAALNLGRCCAYNPDKEQVTSGIADGFGDPFFDPTFDDYWDPYPYTEVTVMLGKQKGGLQDSVEAALTYTITHDTNAEIRAEAATALGRADDADVQPQLVAALTDPSAAVRARACAALGNMRAYNALDAITAMLQDSDEDVRTEAEIAIELLQNRPDNK